MDDIWYVVIIILSVFVFFLACLAIRKSLKNKKPKVKKIKKEKKVKKPITDEKKVDLKGSYVDITNKFLFRKEFKFLVLVNRVLPKGYVAFPKIGVDLILEPVGNRSLYDLIHGRYIDIVIFEEATMKAKVAIDIYDGTIGDEQLDIECPEVKQALEIAELPLLSFKVKPDYDLKEIKVLIYKVLGIEEKAKEEA